MVLDDLFPDFEIKDGIHGLGVFTTIDIQKGGEIFILTGEILPAPTRTSIEIGENKHIEDAIGAHINHSCSPTAKVDKTTQTFVALRDIKKGEEITFDYNQNESNLASPFQCECCGKKILGRNQKIKV